ncbi:MAG: hypothetical protein QG588_370 [Candidatus Poribacteria bacterium]|nr:hypothetical protein [Candidatus Poribacteria bacterium]
MYHPSLILYQRRMDIESVKVEDVLICEGATSDLFNRFKVKKYSKHEYF